MAIEHKNITDAERHELKGASTANSGQVVKSDGDGTTSWVDPSSLVSVEAQSIVENSNTGNINPSAVDTAVAATFDSTVTGTDVEINSNGTITILTAGYYELTFNLNFSRSGTTGDAIVLARLLINDTQFGFVQGATLASNDSNRPISITLTREFNANDELEVEVLRDSSGNNDGGLLTISTTSTWDDVPAYWVRTKRLAGVGSV